uniref:Stromal cell-derived factor 1 n=4 Tax=Cyprinus carpio TaxID=7962 RepID=A0A8C1K1V2_CYPCA
MLSVVPIADKSSWEHPLSPFEGGGSAGVSGVEPVRGFNSETQLLLSHLLLDSTLCGSVLHTANMDMKVIVIFALMAVVIHAPVSNAKPISLVERCWCRSTVNTVPQRSIRELKFVHTPNCPFQVIAKLKNNKEVCINPETKWLQQYLKNAVNKMKKAQQQQS